MISSCEEALGESWVELGTSGCSSPSPGRNQPLQLQLPLCGSASADEYLRLLREAQRESNQSSARVSPRSSPKSPPNSPNTELSSEDDLRGVYINIKDGDLASVERSVTSDWIWDWSSRPDQAPPKDWKFKHPQKKPTVSAKLRLGTTLFFQGSSLHSLHYQCDDSSTWHWCWAVAEPEGTFHSSGEPGVKLLWPCNDVIAAAVIPCLVRSDVLLAHLFQAV